MWLPRRRSTARVPCSTYGLRKLGANTNTNGWVPSRRSTARFPCSTYGLRKLGANTTSDGVLPAPLGNSVRLVGYVTMGELLPKPGPEVGRKGREQRFRDKSTAH